jgi:16S rRNA U516 pseudouridylate synthase RsuA-like enzyme
MLRKHEYVSFRTTEGERQQLAHLTKATGYNTSELLRTLVMNAQLEKVESFRPTVRLNANSDTHPRQGRGVAAAA